MQLWPGMWGLCGMVPLNVNVSYAIGPFFCSKGQGLATFEQPFTLAVASVGLVFLSLMGQRGKRKREPQMVVEGLVL